jgi:hypothetical protein
VDCVAFFACRVAAAFFAEADRCAFVWAITPPLVVPQSRHLEPKVRRTIPYGWTDSSRTLRPPSLIPKTPECNPSGST